MGRPLGAKNKKVKAREHARMVLNMPDATPLEFLLAVMRSDEFPITMRQQAALGAAHFVHPRLQAVMHSTVPERGSELRELIEELDGTSRGLPHYDDQAEIGEESVSDSGASVEAESKHPGDS